MCILGTCGEGNSTTSFGEKKYSIEDECTYTVLLNDYRNSLILSLLGVESNNPDQAAQIEEISQQNNYDVADAELRAAILAENMNMPYIKEKNIKKLRAQPVNLIDRSLKEAMGYYNERLKAAKDKFTNGKALIIEDAVIDYYIFNPNIDYGLFDTELGLPFINMAKLIAD